MGRVETNIALESWLFGFRPCSGQGSLAYLGIQREREREREKERESSVVVCIGTIGIISDK